MRRSYLVILAMIVVVAVTASAVAVTRPDSAAAVARPGSGPDSPPPNPAWVNPDGTVDPSKAPEYVHVAGPNGEWSSARMENRFASLSCPPLHHPDRQQVRSRTGNRRGLCLPLRCWSQPAPEPADDPYFPRPAEERSVTSIR